LLVGNEIRILGWRGSSSDDDGDEAETELHFTLFFNQQHHIYSKELCVTHTNTWMNEAKRREGKGDAMQCAMIGAHGI
jgi:hypothetical protein